MAFEVIARSLYRESSEHGHLILESRKCRLVKVVVIEYRTSAAVHTFDDKAACCLGAGLSVKARGKVHVGFEGLSDEFCCQRIRIWQRTEEIQVHFSVIAEPGELLANFKAVGDVAASSCSKELVRSLSSSAGYSAILTV